MIPDRRAEIGPTETVANPQRNGYLPRWARVPASVRNVGAIANFTVRLVGAVLLAKAGATSLDIAQRFSQNPATISISDSLLGVTIVEAFDSECWVGLGLQVEPEFYAKGARISVIESGRPSRRRELLDPTRERVIDLGVAPSNATRDGKDARVVVHFAADEQGRQLTPLREAKVNCGKYEPVKYILKKTPPPVATTQREVTPVTPTVASGPAKVAVTGVPTVSVAGQVDVGKVPTLKVEVEKIPSVVAKVDVQNVPTITAKVAVTEVPTVSVAGQVDVGKVPTLSVDANVRIAGPVQVETNPWLLLATPLSIIASVIGLGLFYWWINRRRGLAAGGAGNVAQLNVPVNIAVNPVDVQIDLNPTLHQGPAAPAQQGP